MAVTPEMIMQVRYEVQDVTPGLYILDDNTYTYFLEKNNENVKMASLDAARAIMFRLSLDSTEEVVDIMSIKTKSQAEQYRLALQMYISDPNLNPLYQTLQGWVGGVSKSEMRENDLNLDNNIVISPSKTRCKFPTDFFSI